MERIVLASSDEGDLVYDPFAGVGTCPLVCQRLGRDFIAVEINAEYVKLANERLSSTKPLLRGSDPSGKMLNRQQETAADSLEG